MLYIKGRERHCISHTDVKHVVGMNMAHLDMCLMFSLFVLLTAMAGLGGIPGTNPG